MAETQSASTGYNGEVWVYDGASLYELVGVVGFKLPSDARDRVDASTLKDLRPVTIGGRFVDGSFIVPLIYRPRSTTDSLLHTLNASQDLVAMKACIPELDGDLVEDWLFNGRVIGYEIDELSATDAMRATLTIQVEGETTRQAHA